MSKSKFVYSGIIKTKVMSGKKKYRSGKLNPVTESILVDALKLWQKEFVADFAVAGSAGAPCSNHPNSRYSPD